MAAWEDDFTRVSEMTMIIIGIISLFTWGVDFFASYFTVKKAKASKLALYGTLIGAVVGILGGVVGLIIGPIIGAIVGEFISLRNTGGAARVGIAAGLGFVLALVAKLVLTMLILAIFSYTYFY